MATHITLDQLTAAGACESQRDEFSRLFPTGKARVTIKRAKALASVFDWAWAAYNLLTAPARAVYDDARAAARAASRAAMATARAAYNAAIAEAGAAYAAAMAEAFARAYLNQ